MDNNAAECYNSILAKAIGGKRINYSLRRSYETRCEKAAISYNIGTQTSRVLVKKICNQSPGSVHKNYIQSLEKAPADEDYGLPSIEMDEAVYVTQKQQFMDSLSLDKDQAKTLERATIGQADTLLWMEERSKRITASASPDGLIDDDGIIEVKCPKTCSNKTPREGIESKVIKFATIENDSIKLKRNDNYFFQIQGQLHISNRKYCYFIIWTPLKMEFEKIYTDDEFWAEKVNLQLRTFFFKCLLPESSVLP
ncbi:unnamed protein product [Ceutorhynchus assimilis]|uniref:YqaJ viral recombinase domain-containing protein n=1 Tax=Ceutorhynchus assimilis TaxID=467358 RepID=A0A9N9MCB9_9CUCU|nr:unnamed protein product [Ceutorhynchus assimilis]